MHRAANFTGNFTGRRVNLVPGHCERDLLSDVCSRRKHLHSCRCRGANEVSEPVALPRDAAPSTSTSTSVPSCRDRWSGFGVKESSPDPVTEAMNQTLRHGVMVSWCALRAGFPLLVLNEQSADQKKLVFTNMLRRRGLFVCRKEIGRGISCHSCEQ